MLLNPSLLDPQLFLLLTWSGMVAWDFRISFGLKFYQLWYTDHFLCFPVVISLVTTEFAPVILDIVEMVM